MITVTLPGVPRGKGRPRFVRKTGRTYTPEQTASYEGALRDAAQKQMGDRPPLDCPLAVSIVARFPVPTSWTKKKQKLALAGDIRPTAKPDFDNLAKVVDAFNAIIWRDDSLVVDAHIRKVFHERPALVVEVRLINDFMEC